MPTHGHSQLKRSNKTEFPRTRVLSLSAARNPTESISSWKFRAQKAVKSVITPLFSSGRLQAAGKDKKTRTSLFYKTYPNVACMTSNDCVRAGPVLVRGVVKEKGLFDLEASERISMQNSGFPLADKFVFVGEEEPNPIAYYLYLLAGVALIIASLLPRALYRKQF